MKTPILGSTYVTRSVNAADARLVNLFAEIIPEAGKEPVFLNRAPGMTLRVTVGTGPIRGMLRHAAYLYVASGTTLHRVDSSYTVTTLGTISGTGPVSMSNNGVQLFVACDGPSYIYNFTTLVFAQITDIDFPGAKTVTFLDGYFVFTEPNSQKFWVTAILNGLSVDPLDFASAEGSPDNLVAVIADHREIWLFGEQSVEVWYNSGGADFPLSRINGAFNELGCAAAYSVAKADNGLFWLGSDDRGSGVVYRSQGYNGARISTHAVEWQIQQYSTISDAIGYTYQQDGHTFYVLTFPTANATWVYDASTNAWHERAGWTGIQFMRHRSNCQAFYNNLTLVGDFENGNVYSLDLDVYADNGGVQKWLRTWRALETGKNDLKRTAQHALQLDCETGVGLNGFDTFDPELYVIIQAEDLEPIMLENGNDLITEAAPTSTPVQGANPQVMLRWSDDGGHTWVYEQWRSMGKIGEYGYRTIWRRLGMTTKLRDRVYEISGTDPVKIAITGAELQLSPTNG